MTATCDLTLTMEDGFVANPRNMRLFRAIDETGSITKAASEAGLSYKTAWDLIDAINSSAPSPLVVRAQGKCKNSGSHLSPRAKDILRQYELISKAQNIYVSKVIKRGLKELNLGAIDLKLSARNQLYVEITDIKEGAVDSKIVGSLPSGDALEATVTIASQRRMGLEKGLKVWYIFKAPKVVLLASGAVASCNYLKARVLDIKIGSVNAKVICELKGGEHITSIIANESMRGLRLSVGAEVSLLINPSDILIGA